MVWNGSWLDSDPLSGIASYWMWRQVPLTAAQAAVARGAAWLDANAAGATTAANSARTATPDIATLAAHGLYTIDPNTAAGYAWEFVTSLAASGFPTYSYVASTTSDSMASGQSAHRVHGAGARRRGRRVLELGARFGLLGGQPPARGARAVPRACTQRHEVPPRDESEKPTSRLPALSRIRRVVRARLGQSHRLAARHGIRGQRGRAFPTKLSAVDDFRQRERLPLLLHCRGGTTDAPGAAPPRELALDPSSRIARPLTLLQPAQPGSTSLAIYDAAGGDAASPRGWRAAGNYTLRGTGATRRQAVRRRRPLFVRLEVPGRALKREIRAAGESRGHGRRGAPPIRSPKVSRPG